MSGHSFLPDARRQENKVRERGYLTEPPHSTSTMKGRAGSGCTNTAAEACTLHEGSEWGGQCDKIVNQALVKNGQSTGIAVPALLKQVRASPELLGLQGVHQTQKGDDVHMKFTFVQKGGAPIVSGERGKQGLNKETPKTASFIKAWKSAGAFVRPKGKTEKESRDTYDVD